MARTRAPKGTKLLDSDLVRLYLLDETRQGRYGAPLLEHRFAKPARQWRLDFAYPTLGVAIEVEGGTFSRGPSGHTSGVGYADNCRKYDVAALLGWLVIRVTTDMVAHGEAWTLIDAALELRRAQGAMMAAPLPLPDHLAATIAQLRTRTPRKAQARL